MSEKMRTSDTPFPRNRYRPMASAMGTPKAVAIRELNVATVNEWTMADVRSETSNGWRYHSVVNPCHANVTRWAGAWLKLYTIITRIGTTVYRMTSQK